MPIGNPGICSELPQGNSGHIIFRIVIQKSEKTVLKNIKERMSEKVKYNNLKNEDLRKPQQFMKELNLKQCAIAMRVIKKEGDHDQEAEEVVMMKIVSGCILCTGTPRGLKEVRSLDEVLDFYQ